MPGRLLRRPLAPECRCAGDVCSGRAAVLRDYFGFTLDWEHRFEPGLPLYLQVSRSKAVLHLCPSTTATAATRAACFPVADVYGLREELLARPGAPMRPGVDEDSPGGPTLEVIDPYGNVLRFAQVTDS